MSRRGKPEAAAACSKKKAKKKASSACLDSQVFVYQQVGALQVPAVRTGINHIRTGTQSTNFTRQPEHLAGNATGSSAHRMGWSNAAASHGQRRLTGG